VVIAVAAMALLFLACLGAGAATLRLLGVLDDLPRGERLPWSFALGIGVVGWVAFFPAAAGFIAPPELAILGLAGAAGLYFLFRAGFMPEAMPALDRNGWLLCAAIAMALVFDLLEGVSPPSDADSLAYHFALPKQFLAAGGLEFVPRAVDGAAPLLLHMTYLIALGLGGETALTLWAMVSGWMPGLLVFAVSRRFLDLNWSLAVALIFLTTPAVLYGGGAGQMETRLALFALSGAFAVGAAMRGGGMRHVVLAGLLAGFYAGAKFTGFFFIAACGLTLLLGRRRVARGTVFGLVALAAGGQWYGWNWFHTGDPMFPMLFSALGMADSEIWNAVQDSYFRATYFGTEAPVSRSPLNLLTYPFWATLSGDAAFESRRTGLGPYGLLILPFALAGVWTLRRRLRASQLAVPALVVLLFYAIWFFTGSSQRVRHLLPVYPVVLICLTVAARRWVGDTRFRKPAAAALVLVSLTQLAGHAVFAKNYARYVFSGETRDAFLRRTVSKYPAMAWINRNLDRNDKVLTTERQLIYLAEIPVYYSHTDQEALIENHPGATDPVKLFNQLKKLGITHVLASDTATDGAVGIDPRAGYRAMLNRLAQARCMEPVKILYMNAVSSRTLPSLGRSSVRMTIYALRSGACRL
jgi:hypothetical protein